MRRFKRILKVGMCVLIGALTLPILGPISMLPMSHPAQAYTQTQTLEPQVRIFADQKVEARVSNDESGIKTNIVLAKNNVFQKFGDGWRGKRHRHTPDVVGKIGDGWRKAEWLPKGEKVPEQSIKMAANGQPSAKFVAQFRCQCAKSTDVGDNHGDVTIPYISDLSIQDARQKALNEYNSGIDLCQKYSQMPSTDMRMVQGSGGFVN